MVGSILSAAFTKKAPHSIASEGLFMRVAVGLFYNEFNNLGVGLEYEYT